MPTTGATGYDTLTGAGYPSATVTDFSLYVQATMSAAWQAAFAAAGADTGRIRVTDAMGTEFPRDILSYSSGVLSMRVLWSGARGVGDYPVLRVYPDATGSYAVTDTYGGQAAYSGMDGYWPLDDLSNRITGANATASGAASGEGKLGTGYVFDGSGGIVTTDLTAHAAARTYMVWAQRVNAGQKNAGRMWEKAEGNDILYTDARSYIYARQRTGGTQAWRVAIPASSNQWHHIAVTHDGSTSDPAIYLNGVAATVSVLSSASGDLVSSSNPYAIGNRASDSARSWNGSLDDVQIHSVVRSAAWIAYEYGITSNPTAFWANGGWTSLATGSSIAAIAAYYRRMRA